MSIGTDVARIKGNITAALAAIADKGVTVPDGSTSDALAELIASIEAGGGGSSISIKQGSVTFAAPTTSYQFVEDTPDIFIAYVETDNKPVYSSSQFVWAFIQDTRLFEFYDVIYQTGFYFGYTFGSKRYYTPSKSVARHIGWYSDDDFYSALGETTYRWYAIYGVTAT